MTEKEKIYQTWDLLNELTASINSNCKLEQDDIVNIKCLYYRCKEFKKAVESKILNVPFMKRTLKQITRDEFMNKPGRVHRYLNKYGIWNLYCYSELNKSYMKKTENLDNETIRDWHKVSEKTVIKHIKDIF